MDLVGITTGDHHLSPISGELDSSDGADTTARTVPVVLGVRLFRHIYKGALRAPPSDTNWIPVTNEASSEAKKSMAFAMSMDSPTRPTGPPIALSLGPRLEGIMIDYLITLTRIPFGPNSSARHWVNISSAHFDIEYRYPLADYHLPFSPSVRPIDVLNRRLNADGSVIGAKTPFPALFTKISNRLNALIVLSISRLQSTSLLTSANTSSGFRPLGETAAHFVGITTGDHHLSPISGELDSMVITGRNADNLSEVAKQCAAVSPKGLKPLEVLADVSKDVDCKRLIDSTISAFKRLDILVNNAGKGVFAPITDPSVLDKYQEVMDTNLRSVVYLTHLSVEHLEKTKGNIINISSVAGLKPFGRAFLYCMSKCALDMFTKCLALELGPKGIRVNVINPAAVRTNFLQVVGLTKEQSEARYSESGNKYPVGRVGESIDIANAILFLASDEASFVTGVNFVSDGGALNAPL
ncbi:unnamed protein product [Medioppia subpectinata]|uniref:Uncharacterized protein n=1 Tax=Medioppia subpectinata TaxID=1979941 RepID=A0A7R9PYH0_9ACAR|nr:unnamed protein product [Medioppia subpectinata]CAG2105059.1 unnamed protein product [Medioppia subpectinata]